MLSARSPDKVVNRSQSQGRKCCSHRTALGPLGTSSGPGHSWPTLPSGTELLCEQPLALRPDEAGQGLARDRSAQSTEFFGGTDQAQQYQQFTNGSG